MFLLIWKGWGFVVPLVAVVFLAIGLGIGRALHADTSVTYALTAIALVPAGAVCWFAGKRLNSKPPRVLVDPKTGAHVVLRRESSFFFLAVEWWGPLLAAIGVLAAIVELAVPQ
jgi:hypothetical protein